MAFLDQLLSFALPLAAALAIFWAVRAFGRWRRGEQLVSRKDGVDMLGLLVNVAPFLAIIPLSDLLTKWKLGLFAEMLVVMGIGALLALPTMAAYRRVEAMKRHAYADEARSNPASPTMPAANAPVVVKPFSIGETAGALKESLPALLALGLILGVSSLAMALLDLHQMWAWWLALGVALGVPLYMLFGRYPGTITKAAEIDIAAPPERVWSALATYASDSHWEPNIVRIDRLPGPGERYASRMRSLTPCMNCSFPRSPDRVEHSAYIEVLEREPGISEKTRLTQGEGGVWFMRNMFGEMISTKRLTPIAAGTRVSSQVSVTRPKMFLAMSAPFVNLARAALDELKAEVEGSPTSSMQAQREKLDEIRRAPKYCSCVKG